MEGRNLSDFLPKWWTDEEAEAIDQQEQLANKAATTFGAFGGKPGGS